MLRDLAALLAARHPDARIERREDEVAIVVGVDDSWQACRVRVSPVAEVFVALPPLDGFELEVSRRDRWGRDVVVGDPVFDGRFFITSNDEELARLWLDPVSRQAIDGAEVDFAIEDGRLSATFGHRPTEELDALDRGLVAACRVAGFLGRWAAAYAEVGRALGGAIPTDRVELGGRPVLRLERRGVEVAVHLRRRRGRSEGLRTLVAASRASMRWDDPARRKDRIRTLLERSGPSAAELTDSAAEVWFDGAVADLARLQAAIELCARWVVDVPDGQGPYR